MGLKKFFKDALKVRPPVEVGTPPTKESNGQFKNKKVDLMYRFIRIDHLENSDIPDGCLKSVHIGGYCSSSNNRKNVSMRSAYFIFAPVKGKIYWKDVDKYIRVVGEAERKKKGTWEKDYLGLKFLAEGLQKIVGGKLLDLDDEENKDPSKPTLSCFIVNPEMEMTQKSIATIAGRIRNELGASPMGVKIARYVDVIPKNPNTRGLGFNLPGLRICLKEWK